MALKRWQKIAAGGGAAAAIACATIATFEGMRYVPYGDVGGIPTVCEGVTAASLPPGVTIDPAHTYTPAECVQLDSYAEHKAQAGVEASVHVPLTQAQLAAFTDFTYNVGLGAWYRSTARALVNQGHIRAGCNQLLRWVYAGGHKLRGLVARRQAEWQLCVGQY